MSKSRTEIDKEIMYRKIMPSASKRDAKTAQADTGNSGAGQSDTALYDRVNALWKNSCISFGDFFLKNSGLAVISVSTNRVLSLRVRQPACSMRLLMKW